MTKRLVLVICVLVMILIVPAESALAGSASVTGTIDAADPTMPVVFITTPNCTGQGVSPVLYEVQPLRVDTAGVYTLTLASTGGFASVYLYAGSFDPTNGLANCIAADNSGAVMEISINLDPSVQYFVVPFDDTFAQVGGSYTLTVTGPGDVTFSVGGCGVSIPAGSVVGEAPLGAYAYYEPGNIAPGVVLNPGTYWVIGQDSSETYYKVVLACQYLWVRKDTMQSSYLPPQNGAPLPQTIVN